MEKELQATFKTIFYFFVSVTWKFTSSNAV